MERRPAPVRPRVGLALGGGSARGWAHIGVIRALAESGISPDLVCGTSIGALVGAAFAAGELDKLERWVRAMTPRDVLGFMDLGLGGGLVKGERLMQHLQRHFADRPIDALPVPFGAVATGLQTGAEVWLRTGSTLEAVRASIALPGLFAPVVRERSVLVDGGLVNPVPVSLARAMGADLVIAVDLSSDMLRPRRRAEPEATRSIVSDWVHKLQDNIGAIGPAQPAAEKQQAPVLFDVLASSLHIMQVRIARSRMAGEPPDVLIAPRLGHLALLDFHRAKEAIDEGRRAVERIAHELEWLQTQTA